MSEQTPEPQKRQTPTERLHEVTMAALQRQAAPPESLVELTLNAKGDVQIAVTVRGYDAALCSHDAEAIFDDLRRRYPRAEPEPADEKLRTAQKVAAIATSRAKAKP